MNNKKARKRFDKYKSVVEQMLSEGLGSFQIAKKIKVPHSTVSGWVSRMKDPHHQVIKQIGPPPKIGAQFSQQGKASASASLTDKRVRTLDDLIEACQVDMEMWELVSFDCKCWEMGRKGKQSDMSWKKGVASGFSKDSGTIFVQPLYSLVAKFKRRQEKEGEELAEYFRKMLADIRAPSWKCKPLRVDAENTLELMIPDLHLGQYSWGEETRCGDYNIEIACDLLKKAVHHMVSEAGPRIKRIAFPVGNDFFNIDNSCKTTTRGTPQDEDGAWQRSFRIGTRALIDIIGELGANYEVDVMVVPGNHDAQRSFYLGEVLAAFFYEHDRVEIDNSAHSRKYRLYGCTLVGYTHGDQESPKDLPMIMAHQEPGLWSQSVYREWHHGHIHHERNNEIGGIKLKHFPALVSPDSWHAKKGYVTAVRSACAIEYSNDGPIRQYNWYPSMANNE